MYKKRDSVGSRFWVYFLDPPGRLDVGRSFRTSISGVRHVWGTVIFKSSEGVPTTQDEGCQNTSRSLANRCGAVQMSSTHIHIHVNILMYIYIHIHVYTYMYICKYIYVYKPTTITLTLLHPLYEL